MSVIRYKGKPPQIVADPNCPNGHAYMIGAATVLKALYPATRVAAINKAAGFITFAKDPAPEIGEIYELSGRYLLVIGDSNVGHRVDDVDQHGHWVSWRDEVVPLVADMENSSQFTLPLSRLMQGRKVA